MANTKKASAPSTKSVTTVKAASQVAGPKKTVLSPAQLASAANKGKQTAAKATVSASSSKSVKTAKKKAPVPAQTVAVVKELTDKLTAKASAAAKASASKAGSKKPLATKPVNPAKAEKTKKPKLVRDSFTMPELEYATLGEVKKLCLKNGVEVKKSQLLRIGLVLLKSLDMKQLKSHITALPELKAGRPKLDK